ncbi:cell division protein FtsQ/DivIB [Aciduricibacillus chroicocephali]|uniref:Cell division protein DivIB n=1 Tax=Aciduricibacillus chroicocephali TaxID=3054939 RepID=A0ABY9KYG9_9BACI|nr:cell division protein FtsQ/DivIB [Bacillaceae bacterium 44XB]
MQRRKNILSIEEHIPKFKDARKKKQNRRLITYLSIFFLLIFFVIYIQSPLSRVHTVHVKGNALLSDSEVKKLTGISRKTNIWSVHKEELQQKLEKNPLIKQATVSRDFPNTVSISVKEYTRIAYIIKNKGYEPLFASGKTVDKFRTKSIPGDAPVLYGFKNSKQLEEMAAELEKLNPGIRKLISEVHFNNQSDKNEKLELFMNDGLIVKAAIHDFAKKMEVYPSIASQIKKGTKGIVHIGVGAYFEKIESPHDEKKDQNNSTEEPIQ